MSFTIDEFEEWANGDSAYDSSFYWDDLDGGYTEYDSPFGRVKWVETKSEYDEGRQNLELVFTIDGRFFQKTGYYDSWAGGAWDGALIEVRPREKMITVYEAI